MEAEEALVSLGQVAAAFAGFSGIVGTLGARSVSELSMAARFRFGNLLINSVGASLFAFVPVVINVVGVPSSTIWVLSSAMLGLFSLSYLLFRRRVHLRIRRLNPSLLRPWMAVFTIGVLVCICIAQFANVLGWPFGRSGSPYVWSIFALLVLSGFQFIILALDPTPNDPPAV